MLSAYGLNVDLPSGWEGTIFVYGAGATHGAVARPILHAGNFALPVDYSAFGTGIVQQITPGRVFAAICEYDPNSATAPLFASPRPSTLTLADFSPATLALGLPGHVGYQKFFNSNGRAFCFYAVLGSQAAHMSAKVSALNSVLVTLSVGPRKSSYYVTSAAST